MTAAGTPRPIVFGEILYDNFPDGASRLGGAPLNVAVHLASFGADPLFVSRVGGDEAGSRALAELERFGVDTRAIQVDPDLPTGEVRVEFEDGEPRFTILEPRAWDAIDAAAARDAIRRTSPALLYHGVLAARSALSRSALVEARALLPGRLFVDVNLRPPWTPVARALELCRGATWLKVNGEELVALREPLAGSGGVEEGPAARGLLAQTGAGRVVITRGARGASLYESDDEPIAVPARPVARAAEGDPVGAGDAFSAVLLLAQLRGWPPASALERAAELAAAVCALRGALPEDPDWHEPARRKWGIA